MRKTFFQGGAVVAALCAAVPAFAQTGYPDKPIRMIVPFSPGGTSDTLARILGQKLNESWGQQVVVDSRPGASGIIGTEIAKRAAADGYTLLLGAAASHAVNPALYPKIGYDAVKDFAPIINLASIPNVVIVNPQVPYKTMPELVAAAKAQPGIITYSSNGAGTSQHMSATLFEMLTGVKMVHVPYKGSSEGVIAVTRGDVNVMFANLPPTLALIKDGRVKAIAVTTAKRLAAFPDLPTVAEVGVPGYEVSTWFALFGPAGTPEPVVQRLNREFAAALADHDTREKLLAQGFTLNGGSPQDLGALVRSELVKWARVVKESGAKVE